MRKLNSAIKRGLDFVLMLIGTIIISPILLVLAILIKCSSKGSVLFKQERLGYHGKTFKIYKFRTMVVNAEHMRTGVVINEKDDPRVTKIGRFLRTTSLDGKVIIGTTTESFENKGFCVVSPIHFFSGRDHFSDCRIEDYEYGKMLLLA